MKRDKETYPKVTLYKSLIFWEECRFCHKEFRRENGFKIVDYKAGRGCGEDPFYTSYCCSDCASSINEVEERIHKAKEDFIKNRPKIPNRNNKNLSKKIYDILNDLYKDKYQWNYTKEIYTKQSENSKDIKEKGLSVMVLLAMNKFEKLKGDEGNV